MIGTISAWAPTGPRILVTGDSHTAGIGASSNLLGMAHRLKEYLGVHDVLAQGQGGTGYLTTSLAGTETMRARIANEITPRAPDLIIDLAGYNDSPSSAAALAGETTLYYNALTAALPNVPVIKIGPPRRGVSPTFTLDQTKYFAIRDAVAADGRYGTLVFNIDSYTADWEHGTGRVGATTGDGNADTSVAADNVHRTDAGHDGWAALMGPAIRSTLGITVTIDDGATYPNERYQSGSYLAFQAINDTVSASSQNMVITPAAFPSGITFNWVWPDAADTSIKSFNAVDFGNYLQHRRAGADHAGQDQRARYAEGQDGVDMVDGGGQRQHHDGFLPV